MGQRNRIGETLRSAREKTGLSVEQAAADAGIPAQYVRLLEGESDVRIGIADELYLIPFFRRYTAFLNLDTTDLLPEFVSIVQDIAGEGSPPLELAYRSSWTRVWRPVAIIGAIAAAAAAILLRNPEGAPPVRDVTTEAPTTVPMALPIERVAVAPETAATLVPTPAGGGPATAAPSLAPSAMPSPATGATGGGAVRELRIEAAEDTWLSVAVDDAPRTNLLLKAGQTRTWTATTGFSLTVGNAGGIAVSLDGQPLPALGRQGQVVRVKLPRDPETAR